MPKRLPEARSLPRSRETLHPGRMCRNLFRKVCGVLDLFQIQFISRTRAITFESNYDFADKLLFVTFQVKINDNKDAYVNFHVYHIEIFNLIFNV